METTPRLRCRNCGSSEFVVEMPRVPACWSVEGPVQPPAVNLVRCRSCNEPSWAPPKDKRKKHRSGRGKGKIRA